MPPEKPGIHARRASVAGLDPALYRGRGQTFAKHVLLKQYLTELAFKVLQAPNAPSEFLYVDAFSGPWQATGELFEDTSFAIALGLLTDVRERLARNGSPPRMRAIFVEKRKGSFERLREELAKFPQILVEAYNAEFEDVVPQIVPSLTRDTFLFGFLDPIGWKGIALNRIAPLLRHRPGEVLVNVMTNGLVRHAENELVQESVDELFGDGEWRVEFSEALARMGSRDAAIIDLYLQRLKRVGRFTYVGSTRIRNPDKDRTYFYLAYGTRHHAGMEVFRRSEKRCVEVQEQVARDALEAKQEREHGMADLFKGQQDAGYEAAFRRWLDASHRAAKAQFEAWLASGASRRANELRAELLEHPHVDATLVNSWARDALKAGRMTQSGTSPATTVWQPSANAGRGDP